MNMDVTSANYQNMVDNSRREWKKSESRGTKRAGVTEEQGNITRANESKLSSKAQEYLGKLRKQYGDYDLFVGNSTDDLRTLAKSGGKEFTVIFSNAELERMANDETYAQEKLQSVERAVKMSREINEKYGFDRGFGKEGEAYAQIIKTGIIFHDDGTSSFFAELEKSGAKQRERIEKAREEKSARKKAEKEVQSYSRNSADTKRAYVRANSMEELMKKIEAINWDTVRAQNAPERGGRYDFSI